MQQKAKKKDFAKNKRAFDAVMHHYRSLLGVGLISAVNIGKSGAAGSPNPARPTPLDFKCDVEKVIGKIVPLKYMFRFIASYISFEADTDIMQERLADKILGGIRHSFEQRAGAEFHKRKLFPVQGRGYFHCIRRARGK